MAKKIKYQGLTPQQVEANRQRYGANVLTPPEHESLWKRFFEKFTGPLGHHIRGWNDGDPLIFILEIAAVLSIAISFAEYRGWVGDDRGWSVFFDPLGILIAILLATGIAFIFEVKADREFALLNTVDDDEPVKVVRDRHTTKVPKRDIVRDDIVLLSAGDEVPADGELLEATMLTVDESSLTGEPLCRKSADPDMADPNATFATNHVMRGTKVMEGHAVMRVIAVGDSTENGKVMEAAQIDNSVKTPLNEQLDRLGRVISWGSYTVAALIVVGRIISYFIYSEGAINIDFLAYMMQTIMIAVTLIVVAVPEGLPMAVTLSLAYSMRRMLKSNNLVRRMHACETMGAATVICTDKTGTLTQNQMQVYQALFYGLGDDQRLGDDELSQHIARGIAVNSTAQLDTSNEGATAVVGNPTEGATLLWLLDNGIDYNELRDQATTIAEIPFSTEYKYMATVVETPDGQRTLYVKGAPEIVVAMCSQCSTGDIDLDALRTQLKQYQSQALRTLAFAYQPLDNGDLPIDRNRLTTSQMTLLGVVAISDPVRTDVPPAIEQCTDAGIQVKVVTGDTSGTAIEVAKQIGLWHDDINDNAIITGPEFAELSDAALRERVDDLKVIARARPMDKKRLVEALQERGHVVAVTGDGTNDAPALKMAQVGLSMGDGTSVAKQVSDITIIDNSFTSITKAVMWGRSLYQNIQRFILFQLTVNVAACLLVLAGAFMGTETSLTVTQMLWVNLIMDTFAAMALASLPPNEAVMNDKPRNRFSFIINCPTRSFVVVVGGIFSVVMLALLYVLEHSDITSMTDLLHAHIGPKGHLTIYEQSILFTIFVMLQFWNMFNAKGFLTSHSALRGLRHCRFFNMIMVIIFIGQVLIVSFGGKMFNVTPLPASDWAIITIITLPTLLIGELWRLWRKKRGKHGK